MNDYCFEEPDLLHQWLKSFSEEDWQLDKLTWLLEKHQGIYQCSLQNKNELAQLLLLLRSQLSWIQYYIEIGVCRCGTFYLVDQFLKTFAPNYRGSYAIDGWHAPWTKFGLAEYITECPWVAGIQREIQRVGEHELPQQNVFVFIDCDHSYEVTKIAFQKVKNFARLIVFDDIHNKNYEGPNRVYQEIDSEKFSKFEIRTSDLRLNNGNGFGVVGAKL